MRPSLLVVCFLIASFSGFANAELYKYYDGSGTLCITDNYLLVPMDQRKSIETIHEITTQPVVSIEKGADKDVQQISGKKNASKEALASELEQEAKKLETIRKELLEYYSLLKERQDKLILHEKNKMTSKEAQEHNQNIMDLNQDTLKYKEKKQVYLKKLEEYNLKLESVYE